MPKPKVFVNRINKEIKNNRRSYYFKSGNDIPNDTIDQVSINKKINDFFNSDEFVYKLKVKIDLKNHSSITDDIIAVKDGYLITIDGNKVLVSDIVDIKKAN